MSLSLVSLSSGSRGNCTVVFSETASVVIDAGICFREIKNGLTLVDCLNKKEKPRVLVTHAHSDHVGHLEGFTRQIAPEVFCCHGAYEGVDRRMGGGRLTPAEGDFFVGDLTISPFSVSHDLPCVGYSVYSGGRKISVVTDTGCITRPVLNALMGSEIVFLEANHDEQLLKNNSSYPHALKNRILSGRGHLSNDAAAAAAVMLAEGGTRQIILGHLSEENNYPELAYSTVASALSAAGIKVGLDVLIDVAGCHKMSKVFKLA